MIRGGSSVRDGTAASAELSHAPILRIGGLSTSDQWHIGRTNESNDLQETDYASTQRCLQLWAPLHLANARDRNCELFAPSTHQVSYVHQVTQRRIELA
jgi:hypothetical protein